MRNELAREQSIVELRSLCFVWTVAWIASVPACSGKQMAPATKQTATGANTSSAGTPAGVGGHLDAGAVSGGAGGGGASVHPVTGASGMMGMSRSGRAGSSGAAGSFAGAGGSSVDAGGHDSGESDASTEPASYPALDPAMIGMPTQVAKGFALAESPLWDPCEHRLLFTDVSASGGGKIKALDAAGSVTEVMSGTGNANGMAWDVDGSLILAQMSGHVARRDPSGMVTVIDSDDTRLHTPDDVVVRSDGTIYLSDGDFCPIGSLLGYNSSLPVYTIKPNTQTLINSGMIRGPNGIELSPDEKTLYVNGYGDGTISRFDVMPDGTVMKQSDSFVTGLSSPDSSCLDAAGNLYVGVSNGIQVIKPDGSKLKLISIDSATGACTRAGITNCTFGGDDGKTLFITSWTAIYEIENMPIPGLDWIVGRKRAKCM